MEKRTQLYAMLVLFAFITIMACEAPTQNQPTSDTETTTTVPTETPTEKPQGSIIKTIEYYKVKSPATEKVLYRTENFNKKGVKTNAFTYQGTETKEEIYEIDTNGNVTKYTSKDPKGVVDYEVISKYDGDKLLEESMILNGETTKTTNEYNNKGQVRETKEFNADGTLDETTRLLYQYNGDNIVAINTIEKRGDGEFQDKQIQEFTYNDKGQVTKESSIARFGTTEYLFTYYPNGKVKEKTTFSYNGAEKIVLHNDETGKRIKEEIFRKKSGQDFKLDVTNQWTYDKNGNEILFENFRNGQSLSKTIREITYW